jgi:hypothetical protein
MSYPVFYKKSDGSYEQIPNYTYNASTGAVAASGGGTVTPPPPANVELKIVRATASSSEEGNGPENVLDNNEETRWSAQGLGQKLNLDLGGTQEINSVDITWFKGNERSSKADIQIDGTKVASVQGDGTNPKTMTPIMPPRKGNMVTIVGQGNSQNDWNSITTAKLMGRQLTQPSTPTEPTAPTPEPPASTGMDAFGIKMIYPTKSGGRVFNAPLNTGSQRTLRSNQRDGNSDMIPLGNATYTIYPSAGEMKMAGSAPRLYVYDAQRAKMWENAEITCYYKSVSTTSSVASYQGFELGIRGQHELAGSNARVYYSRHSYSGAWYRMKEDVHPTSKDVVVSSGNTFSKSVWYGMKHIVRNVGSTDVKIESYRDITDGKNGGNWVKMFEYIDKKSAPWAGYPIYRSGTPNCACRSVFSRTDNSVDFRIKKFSIREIAPL